MAVIVVIVVSAGRNEGKARQGRGGEPAGVLRGGHGQDQGGGGSFIHSLLIHSLTHPPTPYRYTPTTTLHITHYPPPHSLPTPAHLVWVTGRAGRCGEGPRRGLGLGPYTLLLLLLLLLPPVGACPCDVSAAGGWRGLVKNEVGVV